MSVIHRAREGDYLVTIEDCGVSDDAWWVLCARLTVIDLRDGRLVAEVGILYDADRTIVELDGLTRLDQREAGALERAGFTLPDFEEVA